MIHKKFDIAKFTSAFAFKQNNDDKRNKSHISFNICFRNVAFHSARDGSFTPRLGHNRIEDRTKLIPLS